jgi:hypothetical protein
MQADPPVFLPHSRNTPSRPLALIYLCILDQHHLSHADAEYPWFTPGLLAHLKPLDYLSLKSLLCLHL